MKNNITIGFTTHGNRKNWVKDVIDSLYYFNSEIKFKLIIVDNASTDDTLNYLYTLKQKKDIKIIENKTNVDDTIGINQILRICESELFLKIDSDVIFTDFGIIEKAINLLNSSNYSVIGPYWDLSLRRKDEIFNWSGFEKSKENFIKARQIISKINSHFDVTLKLPRGNFLLMRTKDIIKIGLFEESYTHNAMEYPLVMKLLENDLDYGNFEDDSVIHKPNDEQREIIRNIISNKNGR